MASRREGPPAFSPSYFDLSTGGEIDPALAFAGIADAFASTARHSRNWTITSADDIAVGLTLLEQAALRIVIGFQAKGKQGDIHMSPDPSGWVLVTVFIDGEECFRAYLDHVWEEYEFHPSGAQARAPAGVIDADEPGRIGKRRNWVSIDARKWPQLEPLASRFGYVSIREAD